MNTRQLNASLGATNNNTTLQNRSAVWNQTNVTNAFNSSANFTNTSRFTNTTQPVQFKGGESQGGSMNNLLFGFVAMASIPICAIAYMSIFKNNKLKFSQNLNHADLVDRKSYIEIPEAFSAIELTAVNTTGNRRNGR